MCVIDTETTGLDPEIHEIWQLCILPLNHNLEVMRDKLPFYILMKPEKLHYIDWDVPVFKKNKQKILDASIRGHDPFQAVELLEQWIQKLGLPVTKYGRPMPITPLGQNYGFDRAFLQRWLGHEQYDAWFHWHYRDTMQAALYLNDRAAFHANKVPFSKVDLRWICVQLGVDLPPAHSHDALYDCKATAEAYKKMCQNFQQGILS